MLAIKFLVPSNIKMLSGCLHNRLFVYVKPLKQQGISQNPLKMFAIFYLFFSNCFTFAYARYCGFVVAVVAAA